jgi:transcriptional regulator with XRE-family HTH domain
MQDERPPPARPWFDLVTERIAVRGWSIAELARKAHVSRPTIYGWRDNPARPQAKPVNAVADALGIPRERALRLAGIIAAADRSPPSLLDEELGTEDADLIRGALREIEPERAGVILAGIEDKFRKRSAGG